MNFISNIKLISFIDKYKSLTRIFINYKYIRSVLSQKREQQNKLLKQVFNSTTLSKKYNLFFK